MPRPSPDRVIHDWTFAILPVAAGFVLIILTVVALVYSIGVKTAIPEGLAIAFAGLSYGLFGLWMGGHLVRYCRGHYTRGGIAEAVTPPSLPLTGIATGADGATMAAGPSIVLPISYQQLQQQGRQNHQEDHRQQQRQYTQQYQSRQNQEQHHQQQCQQGPSPRPHMQSPPSPSPQGQFRQQQQQQQQQQQRYHPQRDQQPPPPHQIARRPSDPRNTLLNQVPTVLQPGPRQRQSPSEPNSRTDQQRTSSVQLTPVEAYSGCRSHSLDVPRTLHRENRQVSRETPAQGASSADVTGPHPQGNQSRVTPHHRDVERDPRRASVRSASLDSGTRQSLQARDSQLPVVIPFGSGWANTGQHNSLAVAPLRIRKEGDQSQAPSPEEPYPSAWAPAGQQMQMSQQAGRVNPNLHGPRPQPQSNPRANGSHAIRVVSESPPGNDIAATQPVQAEVRGRHLAPAPAPSSRSHSPAMRFEDIDHPGVQRTSQTSNALRAVADGILEHVSRGRTNANHATNFVFVPTCIFTHNHAVDLERSNARIFGVLYEDAGDEKPRGLGSELRYKHDSGIIVEGPNDAERSSTPSSCWSSWSSRPGATSTSGRSE